MLAAMDRTFRFEKMVRVGSVFQAIVADASVPNAKHMVQAFASHFPSLRAVVTAPIIVPATGRIIDKPGYDADTGLYVHVPDDWPGVPDSPSRDEVERALQTLWWPVRLFPFAEPVDDTVMLTMMLTAVVRPLLPTAPGFAFDAPIQASGKTLLMKVVAALGGYSTAVSPQPESRDDSEMRKRLFALLLGGYGVIGIDNIVGEFDSASLAALLTSEEYSDRVLGESRSESVPSTALVTLSGNNLVLKGDMARRILRCRIDPRTERPHQRAFDFDPVEVVKMHRSNLVAAALTILKAHFLNPPAQRIGPGRTASFEGWDDLVRQAVCGLANQQSVGTLPSGGDDFPRLVDPMEAINNATQQDPGQSQHGRLIRAWANEVGTGSSRANTVSVKDLISISTPKQPSIKAAAITGSAGSEPSLYDVLVEIAGNQVNSVINSKSLGKALAKYKDRVIEGRRLRQGPSYQGSATWWVEEVGEFGGFGGLVSPSASIGPTASSIAGKGKKATKPTKPKNDLAAGRSRRRAARQRASKGQPVETSAPTIAANSASDMASKRPRTPSLRRSTATCRTSGA